MLRASTRGPLDDRRCSPTSPSSQRRLRPDRRLPREKRPPPGHLSANRSPTRQPAARTAAGAVADLVGLCDHGARRALTDVGSCCPRDASLHGGFGAQILSSVRMQLAAIASAIASNSDESTEPSAPVNRCHPAFHGTARSSRSACQPPTIATRADPHPPFPAAHPASARRSTKRGSQHRRRPCSSADNNCAIAVIQTRRPLTRKRAPTRGVERRSNDSGARVRRGGRF